MRQTISPVRTAFAVLVLVFLAAVAQQASSPQEPPPAGGPGGPGGPPPQPQRPDVPPAPTHIPLELFSVPDGMEATLWAETPMVHNPTNMDIDRDGRIWVAEGVRYRRHFDRQPAGDKIVVLEDTN